jgi:hypothetical protein
LHRPQAHEKPSTRPYPFIANPLGWTAQAWSTALESSAKLLHFLAVHEFLNVRYSNFDSING